MNTILILIIIILIAYIVVSKNKKDNSKIDIDIHEKKPAGNHVYYKMHEQEIENNRMTEDYSVKNLDVEDKSTIFYDKNVVITGTFNSFARNDVAKLIHSKGGCIKQSLTTKTEIIIIGNINPGPSKLQKIDELIRSGSKLQVIQEDELMEIIKDFSKIV